MTKLSPIKQVGLVATRGYMAIDKLPKSTNERLAALEARMDRVERATLTSHALLSFANGEDIMKDGQPLPNQQEIEQLQHQLGTDLQEMADGLKQS